MIGDELGGAVVSGFVGIEGAEDLLEFPAMQPVWKSSGNAGGREENGVRTVQPRQGPSREGVDGAFGQDHGLRWGKGNGQPEASGRFSGTGGHHPEAAAVGAHQGAGNFGSGNPALSIGAWEDRIDAPIGPDQAALPTTLQQPGREATIGGQALPNERPVGGAIFGERERWGSRGGERRAADESFQEPASFPERTMASMLDQIDSAVASLPGEMIVEAPGTVAG